MLVEGQGGHLSVSSTPGMGSTFTFSLEFGKSTKKQLPALQPVNTEYRSLRGARILVAEDNIINQKIILKILTKWNASPDLAENGEVALRKVSQNQYDLVLMDLYMPVMNGYEATLAIRKTEGDYYRDLPILALTATALEEDRSKFASAGMNGYILKPFTPPELYRKISYFLK
jgi:CheY-like chemotaxis protein